MSDQVWIEWLAHPTVRADRVGKRAKMGADQASVQITKGRARHVPPEEPAKSAKPKGKKKSGESGDEE